MPESVEFIKSWEDFEPEPYEDGISMSIGYGQRVRGRTHITKAQATKELTWHIKTIQDVIHKEFTGLNANQMTALTSIYYNVAGFPELKKVIHERNFERISRLWIRYCRVRMYDIYGNPILNEKGEHKKKTLLGLQKRRTAERNLFME